MPNPILLNENHDAGGIKMFPAKVGKRYLCLYCEGEGVPDIPCTGCNSTGHMSHEECIAKLQEVTTKQWPDVIHISEEEAEKLFDPRWMALTLTKPLRAYYYFPKGKFLAGQRSYGCRYNITDCCYYSTTFPMKEPANMKPSNPLYFLYRFFKWITEQRP